MTPEQQAAFEQAIYAYVGRKVCERQPAQDAVNPAMIRQWTEVMGDDNPAYTDQAWAAVSARGRTIAPPAMMYVWNQEGVQVALRGRSPDPQSALVDLFNEHGFTGILGTDVVQEYHKEVAAGDQVFMEMVIDNISEQKATARGIGYFFETLATFSDQTGDVIGTQRFRVLKFRPADAPQQQSSEDSALEVPTRIPSPRGHDNGWWWEACDRGELHIQRCKDCGALRHPPRPMCGECQSMEWDSIVSTLRGEVMSFTELHHPRVPGYDYPVLCAVIRLEEGVNFVANLAGCSYDEVSIGMAVEGRIEAVDEKTMLPQFYPMGAMT